MALVLENADAVIAAGMAEALALLGFAGNRGNRQQRDAGRGGGDRSDQLACSQVLDSPLPSASRSSRAARRSAIVVLTIEMITTATGGTYSSQSQCPACARGISWAIGTSIPYAFPPYLDRFDGLKRFASSLVCLREQI
jgi:hypothetical protein